MLTIARTLISYSTCIKERSQIMVNLGISNTVGFFIGSGAISHIIISFEDDLHPVVPSICNLGMTVHKRQFLLVVIAALPHWFIVFQKSC